MFTLSRILPDHTRRPVGHRLGQPVTDALACEVLDGEAIEIGWDGMPLLGYALDPNGVTETFDCTPGVEIQRGTGVAEVIYDDLCVATIQLLDDQRAYVKVFPDGLEVTAISGGA